jgi:hypothetical protein
MTKQMLIDADACRNQVDLFEKTFGDSVTVTIKRAEKVANLFHWNWATHFLDSQGRTEYMRVQASALAKYLRVELTAFAEYDRVTASAWVEYQPVNAIERAKYWRFTANALAECRLVQANAWAEYQRVKAIAWASAFIDMHKRGASK